MESDTSSRKEVGGDFVGIFFLFIFSLTVLIVCWPTMQYLVLNRSIKSLPTE